MHVPEIIEVKDQLEKMKKNGLIKEWELPYENLLTRRSAAIFFLTPAAEDENTTEKICAILNAYYNFSKRPNTEKLLSEMPWRITFSEEQKEMNLKLEMTATQSVS